MGDYPISDIADRVVVVAAPANKSYTKEALTSNDRSTAFTPDADRTFYCFLTGTGAATATLVYSHDGGNTWAPAVTGVDGGAPIYVERLAYAGQAVMLVGEVSKVGMQVAVLPGTVTGAVSVEFAQ